MATFKGILYDPLIDVIRRDVNANPIFKKAVGRMEKSRVFMHRKTRTLHPSDELLEAWYRFKENQTCQR